MQREENNVVQPGNLILVHGLKYSGKSTIAEYIMANYGYVRVKMAGPLKNMTRSLLRDAGIPEDRIEEYVEGSRKEDPILELGGITTRSIMMTLGEEWRNMHSELLWINIAASKIEKLISSGVDVVVDDIRYPFEVNGLMRFRPFRTVVTRGDIHFEEFGEDRHPGERPMEVGQFDFHFKNDFETKDKLHRLVDDVMEVRRTYMESLGILAA